MRVNCTRCTSKATIRTSKDMGATLRQLYCTCNDPECGHSFVMNLSFSHTLSPSALDLPESVRLDLRTKTHGEVLSLFGGLT